MRPDERVYRIGRGDRASSEWRARRPDTSKPVKLAVWVTDSTYAPKARGFVCLVTHSTGPGQARVEWFTRRVPASRVSISLDAAFCIKALAEAPVRCGKPAIFNGAPLVLGEIRGSASQCLWPGFRGSRRHRRYSLLRRRSATLHAWWSHAQPTALRTASCRSGMMAFAVNDNAAPMLPPSACGQGLRTAATPDMVEINKVEVTIQRQQTDKHNLQNTFK